MAFNLSQCQDDMSVLFRTEKSIFLYLTAGLIALSAILPSRLLQAETGSVGHEKRASAHVDFIIHIPEVLSLRIDALHDSHGLTSQAIDSIEPTGKPADSQSVSHISVRAAGTLSFGSVMALTAAGSDPLSRNHKKPDIKAGITWTASGTHRTGSFPKDKPYLLSARHQHPRSFTYDRRHQISPAETPRPIFYIISAP
jgi:hypothetical protein